MSSLDQIRNYLVDKAPGPISKACTLDVESLLSSCWDRLAGSRDGGMAADKLSGRVEGLEWSPPMLTFNIERHGGFVLGSTRAEVQKWKVDLDHETAALIETTRRQILPMDRRLDVRAIAAEIATIINERREDTRIKWLAANRVRILTGEVILATNAQTTTSRRKRFASELERLLLPLGWRCTIRNPLSFEQQITVT